MSRLSAAWHKPVKGQSRPSGVFKELKDIDIDEDVRTAVHLTLERFQHSDQKEMEFPSSFSSSERTFVHRMAQSMGYVSISRGKGSSRFVTVRKESSDKPQSVIPLALSHNSMYVMRSQLQKFPITNKEHADLQPHMKSGMSLTVDADNSRDRNRASGCLKNGIPQVPQRRSPSELDGFRCSLPVHECQEEIVQLIRNNRVVLVVGDTGSGKTTQIPQFLLDDCSRNRMPCWILCTQARRLAAITAAERVAAERGESVGQTVGYQIRLESRVSPKTLLTFCTSGVFLRTLMAGDANLSSVTHVIVDEVHERDGLTDLLLTKLRDVLQKIPSLKLILSSAALDMDLLLHYFSSCPVIHIKARLLEVKQLFLEDILRLTGYTNKDMMKYKEEMQRKEKKKKALTKWFKTVEDASALELQRNKTETSCVLDNSLLEEVGAGIFNEPNENEGTHLDMWLLKEMDTCIANIFLKKDANAFIQLFNLIGSETFDVDYMHSETSATPLMVAAGQGFLSQMEQLLNMGADISIKSSNGWTALDWAKHFQQMDAVDLLESYIPLHELNKVDESALMQSGSVKVSAEDQELLKFYHHTFDDDQVDLDLIMHLLYNICSTSEDGAVLIFLPGYDEIVALRNQILYDDRRFTNHFERYQVFTLHSNMHTADQKKVMKSSPPGVRKIILSTNIAETSITVDDVVFVIDSGKVTERTFDALSEVTMLKMDWISKASALQRRGRAGRRRPGICFHLFSRLRFNNMREFQVPQLLRMPLQELCLHTKLLAPVTCPIAEFLSSAPEPPLIGVVRNAMQMLKVVDAINQSEELTDLGYHLADLPVEPHLGKMVLCAVVLKCLDPILTIACALAYGDPFVLPTQPSQKRAALLGRKRFTATTLSDHMALLRAFQAWQKACSDGWERSFCEKNFVSQAIMDMIISMRTQLLGQLRAIGFVRVRGGSDIRDVNLNSENWAVVKAALVAGMYPKLIHVNQDHLSSNKEKKVHFHQTSILSQFHFKKNPSDKGEMASVQALPTNWLIYDEMTQGHRIARVRCCSIVTPITVAIFGGCANTPPSALEESAVYKDSAPNDSSDSDSDDLAQMKIDDRLIFQLDREAAGLVFQLRQRWHSLFLRRIRCPSKQWSQQDEAIVHTLVSVLAAEEKAAGLQQPAGIGQRPRLMLSEEGPQTVPQNIKISPPVFTSTNTISGRRDEGSLPLNHPSDDTQSSSNSAGFDFNSSTTTTPQSSPTSSGKFSKPPSPQQALSSLRYFIMKSSNLQNIEISQQKGIWSTTPSNELKLNKAFLENTTIFLIFSVQGSGHFQGYARMTSAISREHCQDWGFIGLGGVLCVEWIRKENLPFQCTRHLLNPWNENKKVQISRDGQELEPQTGHHLLLLWERNFGSQAQ
ncbi:3'-5' RNA helicase YTHDC2 isoform X2 [Myripristis murdjan]|uniref:3'-5' RNA helicase YTHDC2 isoform X2 n=1 Tax=Myripristis murdjan TaxID=586833 RepID=UPI0011761A35|nr:3'-5' RNA helicase YTHDC2 isoform X2 [Myripristis murdjan]